MLVCVLPNQWRGRELAFGHASLQTKNLEIRLIFILLWNGHVKQNLTIKLPLSNVSQASSSPQFLSIFFFERMKRRMSTLGDDIGFFKCLSRNERRKCNVLESQEPNVPFKGKQTHSYIFQGWRSITVPGQLTNSAIPSVVTTQIKESSGGFASFWLQIRARTNSCVAHHRLQ